MVAHPACYRWAMDAASLAYLALGLMVLLILAPRLVVGGEMKRMAGGYDNHDPRAQQAQLVGRGKRALNAHHNAIEALPPFGMGVLAALQRGVDPRLVAGLALGVVAARTGYLIFYLQDQASLRSACWAVGLLGSLALIGLAVVA